MKNTFVILSVLSAYFCFSQCPSNVVISTNNYSVGLTEVTTFIKISSSVSSSASVKLDADPDNGYVLMKPGFYASPSNGHVFIAQPLDGCGPATPTKSSVDPNGIPIEQTTDYTINIYPNPTIGAVTINFNHSITGTLNIYDLNTLLIYSADFTDKDTISTDLSRFPSGVYIIEISSLDLPVKTFRIIKK